MPTSNWIDVRETAVFCQIAIRFVTVGRLMTALGQKQTLSNISAMSAYPQKRTFSIAPTDVRFWG
jgi:hypothetical protein